MSNSPLVSYTKLSPNHSGKRTHAIDRITPHCVVGQVTVQSLGNVFAPASRQASSNYGIGLDGAVGMYVDEGNRSWCSSSNANDQRAVTIECASDTTAPYAFRPVVYDRLIALCVDICRRNGKRKLIWIDNKDKALAYEPKAGEMLLTVHRWFANKSCPGDWMYARMGDLAAKVTAQLSGSGSTGTGTADDGTAIMGAAKATAAQMQAYIRGVNPAVPQSVIDMIPLYISEGNADGVRGDVAFAQSCLETGNFGFAGSAVTLSQNNFCGMGVTAAGVKGNSFTSPQIGIRAQIQHLKAYASTEALRQACVDPRFKYVQRGSAKYVEWLGQRENPQGLGWAAGAGYGEKILRILADVAGPQSRRTTCTACASPGPTRPVRSAHTPSWPMPRLWLTAILDIRCMTAQARQSILSRRLLCRIQCRSRSLTCVSGQVPGPTTQPTDTQARAFSRSWPRLPAPAPASGASSRAAPAGSVWTTPQSSDK